MTSVKEMLLKTLERLRHEDLEKFKGSLPQTGMKEGFPRQRMKMAGSGEMVDLMVEIYGQQSVEVTREVLQRMRDLLERRSDIILQLRGKIKKTKTLHNHMCHKNVQ